MIIRAAAPDDVTQVLPLARRINKLHESWDPQRFGLRADPAESYEPWLRKRCADPESVFLVAQTPEGQVIGYLVGTIEDEIPIYWQPRCGWIHDLWVEAEYRNEGLARQMTTLAIEKFRETGVKQVRLQTAAANDVGRKLFESCGFRICSTEMLATI